MAESEAHFHSSMKLEFWYLWHKFRWLVHVSCRSSGSCCGVSALIGK
ncbi:17367_t:CDS:2 [Cetraspora pellucida]|uniref:17367_t:CDS:1 n=1 Tax=Cetraspora pellucida TaxID=1433469 RepID=A0A9N9HGS3_9GLOM|nr:17367_t:CDS:2 [Cetraspora pellucida]